MIDAINAERIKLFSTRSPYWCVAVVAVLGVGIALLVSAVAASSEGDVGDGAVTVVLLGLTMFGIPVLMIMGVLAVTSEYRFGTIRTSFQAVPKRANVFVAKGIVYGALTAVVTVVLVAVCLALAAVVGGDVLGISFADGADVRQLWATPIYAVLCVLIGIGVGALVRHTAGAIVIVLVWMLALENTLLLLPRVGEKVGPFLPFVNANAFVDGSMSVVDPHWGPIVSLVYFVGFTALVAGAGLLVMQRRDA